MGIELKKDIFYMLEIGEKKWVFETEEDAVAKFKALAMKQSLTPDDINILEVDISQEKWNIKGIPWSKIALQLIQER